MKIFSKQLQITSKSKKFSNKSFIFYLIPFFLCFISSEIGTDLSLSHGAVLNKPLYLNYSASINKYLIYSTNNHNIIPYTFAAPIVIINNDDLTDSDKMGVTLVAGQSSTVRIKAFSPNGTQVNFLISQSPLFIQLQDNGDNTANINILSGNINPGPGILRFQLTVGAVDSDNSFGQNSFRITVMPNQAPIITPIPTQTVSIGKTKTVQVPFIDPDVGDILTSSVKCDKSNFVQVNGMFLTISPLTTTPLGATSCVLSVADQFGLTSLTNFLVMVKPQTLPPTIASIGDQTVKQNQPPTTIPVVANGTPGDKLILSLSAPAFVSLSDNGNGTGSIRIAPSLTDVQGGRITVTVTDITDPDSSSASTSFNITVQRAVVINGAAPDKRSKQLFINGVGFGSSGANVRINGQDVSSSIIGQSDNSATVGCPGFALLRPGPNQIIVISSGITSNTFVLNLLGNSGSDKPPCPNKPPK